MTVAEIEAALRKDLGRRRAKNTIETYSQILRRFCAATGKAGKWDRDDLLGYFDTMIAQKKAITTINQHFYALKRIFRSAGQKFEMELDDLPRGRSGELPLQPMTDDEDVKALIAWAKGSKESVYRFYLAMSSVYGLRREELSRLTQESFRYHQEHIPKGMTPYTVLIDTAKHGVVREHLMPEYLVAVCLPAIDKKLIPNGITTLSFFWHDICNKAGYESAYKEGWHSVRRSLDTELVKAGLPEPTIRKFLRWSPGSSMVNRYYHEDAFESDLKVFAKHPFLEEWQ